MVSRQSEVQSGPLLYKHKSKEKNNRKITTYDTAKSVLTRHESAHYIYGCLTRNRVDPPAGEWLKKMKQLVVKKDKITTLLGRWVDESMTRLTNTACFLLSIVSRFKHEHICVHAYMT